MQALGHNTRPGELREASLECEHPPHLSNFEAAEHGGDLNIRCEAAIPVGPCKTRERPFNQRPGLAAALEGFRQIAEWRANRVSSRLLGKSGIYRVFCRLRKVTQGLCHIIGTGACLGLALESGQPTLKRLSEPVRPYAKGLPGSWQVPHLPAGARLAEAKAEAQWIM